MPSRVLCVAAALIAVALGAPAATATADESTESPAKLPRTFALDARQLAETRLLVAAGQGVLEILRLKPESGKAMSAEAFCNGHAVRAGDAFMAPSD